MTLKRGSKPSKKPVTKKPRKVVARSNPPTKRGKAKKEPWSEGRLKAFITTVLRAGMRKYPAKYECLKEASVGKKVNEATGRMAEHYKCAECKKDFPQSQVQVDHRIPCINPETGFTTWDDFISRLFCDKTNLQVLCRPCHLEKTKKERAVRNGSK